MWQSSSSPWLCSAVMPFGVSNRIEHDGAVVRQSFAYLGLDVILDVTREVFRLVVIPSRCRRRRGDASPVSASSRSRRKYLPRTLGSQLRHGTHERACIHDVVAGANTVLYMQKPSWCFAVMTKYRCPAAFASDTHSRASNLTGLTGRPAAYSATGIRPVHDPLTDARHGLALPLARGERIEAPVDEQPEARHTPPVQPGIVPSTSAGAAYDLVRMPVGPSVLREIAGYSLLVTHFGISNE